MILPWGVHTIANIYHPDVQAGLPDGRYVAAVAEPFTGNRLTAAWWVLTGAPMLYGGRALATSKQPSPREKRDE
jgi:hypothetical protein